jgi:hypothetical protein
MKRKTSLAALLSLGALATLALVPTHAMAVANNGEVIRISGDTPRDPVDCFRNPSLCLSHQFGGGGGRQELDGDGSDGGPRGSAGRGSAGTQEKREMAKGKGQKPAKEECEELAELNRQIARLERQQDFAFYLVEAAEKKNGAMSGRQPERRWPFVTDHGAGFADRLPRYWDSEVAMHYGNRFIDSLRNAATELGDAQAALEAKKEFLLERSGPCGPLRHRSNAP